jgi:hypothetical protein
MHELSIYVSELRVNHTKSADLQAFQRMSGPYNSNLSSSPSTAANANTKNISLSDLNQASSTLITGTGGDVHSFHSNSSLNAIFMRHKEDRYRLKMLKVNTNVCSICL